MWKLPFLNMEDTWWSTIMVLLGTHTLNRFKIIFFSKKCYKLMANDLVLMVLQFLINLIGIQKGARHLNFDFEKLTLELCFDWMVRRRLKFYSSQNVNNKISQNSNVKHLFVFQLNLSRTVAPWSRDQLTSISGIFKSLTNIKNTLL